MTAPLLSEAEIRAAGIQRYDADMKYIGSGEYVPVFLPSEHGDAVMYEDHVAALAACAKREELLTAAAKFGMWALETSRENMGDLEGGEIQDKALELGLLHEVVVTEPCCDECRCAEYDDFPQKCIRIRVPFDKPLPEKGSE